MMDENARCNQLDTMATILPICHVVDTTTLTLFVGVPTIERRQQLWMIFLEKIP